MKLLRVDSSASGERSVTRQLTDRIFKHLESKYAKLKSIDVDLATKETPFLEPKMIGSYFTPSEDRSAEQKELLKQSDDIVASWKEADLIVLGVPMYNFGMPAKLKAYFDMLARVGETFHYGEQGPVGHLTGKKVYVGVATGGTPIGSPYDHVTPHLKTFLAFLGMTDVEFVAMDQRGDKEELLKKAEETILSWE